MTIKAEFRGEKEQKNKHTYVCVGAASHAVGLVAIGRHTSLRTRTICKIESGDKGRAVVDKTEFAVANGGRNITDCEVVGERESDSDVT